MNRSFRKPKRFRLLSICANAVYNDVAHSIGVQNGFLHFFCLQEPIFDVLVIFFVLKLEVYVCLAKSLLILSFSFIKTVKGELKNSKFRGKTSVTL